LLMLLLTASVLLTRRDRTIAEPAHTI